MSEFRKRAVSILGLVIAASLLVGVGISYSWTFTPQGRLDYRAAVFAKLATWMSEPMRMEPTERDRANAAAASFVAGTEPAPDVRFADRTIPGRDGIDIPIRIYWPETSEPLPLYLDIHGGGWWVGNGFIWHAGTTHFAKRANAIVVSVDYRLAPEHPYPAALDDCYSALEWIHANAVSLGGDPNRIAIGGGSAGGNLAAALAIRARDEGGPRIVFQYLLVPATDLSGTREWESYAQAGDQYMLNVSDLHRMIDAYVPDETLRMLSTVSPLLASDLSGLPAAFIVTAQFDPLRDQGVAYAQALEVAGVQVTLHQVTGALHTFAGSKKRVDRMQEKMFDALRASLHP